MLKRFPVIAMAVSLVGLSACTTTATREELAAAETAEAKNYVTNKLARTADSVDSTLRTLEKLERGVLPVKVESVAVQEQAQVQEVTQKTASAVETKKSVASPLGVTIGAVEWKDASAETVLLEVSNLLNVNFKMKGQAKKGGVGKVSVKYPQGVQASVLLSDIARQIDKSADIVFNENTSTIELVAK